MTNNEKALELVQKCLDDWPFAATMVDDIMNRLKQVKTLLKEKETIVRCKDCKHRPTYPAAYGAEINGKWCYWCELHKAWKHDDWYCADGKRW